MENIGKKARDINTGFSGTIVGRLDSPDGYVYAVSQPQDVDFPDIVIWFYLDCLEIIDEGQCAPSEVPTDSISHVLSTVNISELIEYHSKCPSLIVSVEKKLLLNLLLIARESILVEEEPIKSRDKAFTYLL